MSNYELLTALKETTGALQMLSAFYRHREPWRTCGVDETIKEATDLLRECEAAQVQARAKKYGHFPKRPYKEGLCVHDVWSAGRGSTQSQCARKNGFGPGGLYCKQHDPEAVAKKRAEEMARHEAESKATAERRQRDAACVRALAGIPEPEQAIREAREALEFIVNREHLMFAECADAEDILDVARKALAALRPV